MNNYNIIITTGEPSGVGSDLIVHLAQYKWPVNIIACADPNLLISRSKELSLPLKIYNYSPNIRKNYISKGEILVLPVYTKNKVITGKLDISNSEYTINSLKEACNFCLLNNFSALITGPVNKAVINDSGINFTGHTEFLSKLCQKPVLMMFMYKNIRIALATTHLPLSYVSKLITKKLLYNSIMILHTCLKYDYKISNPCIYVCGLNPHAGENGFLGTEEINIITPLINSLKKNNYNIHGPLPADTIFQSKYLNHADVILTMYHDQLLPLVKYCFFDKIVNVTLGLPFVRTSVCHGTALEIAGSNKVNTNNIKNVLYTTINIMKLKYGYELQ
ncbi:MAG: 4-hydroxythreonine-4-phosphate dehydrogenase PdxA [Candidatus Lightella neohaematopini]|nr:4-hydroxythreonine-4-phosphate dehydrogenase PdxA [Candidatus Lightella neohaematopini]